MHPNCEPNESVLSRSTYRQLAMSVSGIPKSKGLLTVHLPVPFSPALSRILSTSGVAPNALSFRLKELVAAQERNGRDLIYRVPFDHMSSVLAYLTVNC